MRRIAFVLWALVGAAMVAPREHVAAEDSLRKAPERFCEFLKEVFPENLFLSPSLRTGRGEDGKHVLTGEVRPAAGFALPEFPEPANGDQTLQRRSLDSAKLVSAEHTFAFAYLDIAPGDLVRTIPKLPLDETAEWFGIGDSQPLRALAGLCSRGVALAWARLPEVDSIDLDTWGGGVPEPLPAITAVVRLTADADPSRAVAVLRDIEPSLLVEGVREEHGPGGTLYALDLPRIPNMQLFEPGFAIVGRHVLLSSNLGELRRCILAAAGQRTSLSARAEFARTVAKTEAQSRALVWIDGPGLRAHLLDGRWQAAFEDSYFDMRQFRLETVLKLNREHLDWDTKRINREADSLVEARMRRRAEEDFPAAVARYRQSLAWTAPLAWGAFALRIAEKEEKQLLSLAGVLRLR